MGIINSEVCNYISECQTQSYLKHFSVFNLSQLLYTVITSTARLELEKSITKLSSENDIPAFAGLAINLAWQHCSC